jgi:hypothetical protein
LQCVNGHLGGECVVVVVSGIPFSLSHFSGFWVIGLTMRDAVSPRGAGCGLRLVVVQRLGVSPPLTTTVGHVSNWDACLAEPRLECFGWWREVVVGKGMVGMFCLVQLFPRGGRYEPWTETRNLMPSCGMG